MFPTLEALGAEQGEQRRARFGIVELVQEVPPRRARRSGSDPVAPATALRATR